MLYERRHKMRKNTLQDFRIQKGLTQEELAKLTETTKDYISLLERGKRNPSDKMKAKLAKIFDVEIVQIFLAVQRTKCCTKDKNL
jgi:putative transcriptional regulator